MIFSPLTCKAYPHTITTLLLFDEDEALLVKKIACLLEVFIIGRHKSLYGTFQYIIHIFSQTEGSVNFCRCTTAKLHNRNFLKT